MRAALTGSLLLSAVLAVAGEEDTRGIRDTDLRPYAVAVQGAWVHGDRWPNSLTPETFAQDVMRLDAERITCDEDKAIALYRWQTRCYGRSGSPGEGPKGMEGQFADSWKQFHTYGQGLCDKWGRLGSVLARAAGLRARKVTCMVHTLMEVYYKDRDGVERWHLFDPHVGVYAYTRDGGHVASLEELSADPALMFNAPKVSDPFGARASQPYVPRDPTPEEVRAKQRWYKNHVFSRVWPPQFDPRLNLPAGSSFTRYWHRAPNALFYSGGIAKFNENHCKLGWHDPTTRFYENGEIKDKENYPYWKPYLIDCEACGTKGAKPQGHAVFRWRPPLLKGWFDRDAVLSDNVVASHEPGVPRVHPARAREQAVLIYRVHSPYVLADANVRAVVCRTDRHRTTELNFLFSNDEGRTWHEAGTTDRLDRTEPFEVTFNIGKPQFQAGKPSVYGAYAFLLRIDMLGRSDPKTVGLDELEIECVSQLNMWTLPFLLPGKNEITVEAATVAPGSRLEVEFAWDEAGKKGCSAQQRFEKLPGTFTVEAGGKGPDEVRMQYVKLSVLGPVIKERPKAPAVQKAPATEQIRIVLPSLRDAPALDGNIGEDAWKPAQRIEHLYDNETTVARDGATATQILLGQHGGRLYLAALCREPDLGPLSSLVTERDGRVWKDSSVEFFVCPNGPDGAYWRIGVNSKGIVQDALHEGPDKEDLARNLDVQTAAAQTKDGWTLELSVPIKDLGIEAAHRPIPFNFFRNVWGDELGGGRPEEEQAISPTRGSFHERSRFGVLILD